MNLTRGRREPCKNNIGGVKNLYLTTYIEYDVRAIVGYRDLLVTDFPITQIYKYEGRDKSFSETLTDDGYYDQEVSITLTGQDLANAQLISVLVKNKCRAIIEDWLGNKKIIGVVNGLDVEVSTKSGASKVDLNGYQLKLTGMEEFKAPYVNDLEDAGLTDKTQSYGCLLASSDRLASISNNVSDCNVLL